VTDERPPTGPVTRATRTDAPEARGVFGASGVQAPLSIASDLTVRLDALRVAVGEVDVLASVTTDVYDGADWSGSDPEVVDRVACLLGLISRSATSAVTAFHRLHAAVADAQPAPAGEPWADEGASTPG
jgi:hypothetical protein